MPQATLERPNGAEVKLTVTLTPEDYRPAAQAQLKKIASTANIRGFRKGKVPASYMKKMYGRGAVADAIGKAVDEAINSSIKEEKLDIFGQLAPVEEPDMSNLSPDIDETLTFVYEGGLLPRVESVSIDGLREVHRYSVQLTDEEASAKLDNARKRFVDYTERDTIETEEDFATLVVADPKLDEEFISDVRSDAEPQAGVSEAEQETRSSSAEGGAELAPTEASDVADAADQTDADAEEAKTDPRQRYFLRAADLTEEQRYKLIDRQRGGEIILSLDDLNEDVKERFDKAITAGETTTFTIAKVDRESMPELDVDTFKKIFGEDTAVSDEAEAREEFKRRFAANSQENLDDFALEQVIDKLSADNEVELPRKAMVRRLFQAQAEERERAEGEGKEPEVDHELTEADVMGLGRRLKWMAFRQQLLETHKVELDAEDIDRGIEKSYVQQIGQMGLDPEQFREQFFPMFKKNLLEKREQVMEMTDGLLNLKLVAKLEEDGVLGEHKYVGEKEFGGVVEAYNQGVNGELEQLRSQPIEAV